MQKPPDSLEIAAIPAGHPLGALTFLGIVVSVEFDLTGAGLSEAVLFLASLVLLGAASMAKTHRSKLVAAPAASTPALKLRPLLDIRPGCISAPDDRQIPRL